MKKQSFVLLIPLFLFIGCAYYLKNVPDEGGKIKQLYYSGSENILHVEYTDGRILNGKVSAPTIVYPDLEYSLVYAYTVSDGALRFTYLTRKSLVEAVIKPDKGSYSIKDIKKLEGN